MTLTQLLSTNAHPNVMGILNCTPDSFYDGGNYQDLHHAIAHARAMQQQGADIIDIGGESTRPGAKPISVQQELDRVIPIIEALRRESAIPISIDTSQPQVMQAAVAAGANLINDVRALTVPNALSVAAKCGVPVCLMHMQGTPETMQVQPSYTDLLAQISEFFVARMAACEAAGIAATNIILDPGFGFGKTVQHNLALIKHLHYFKQLGRPLLLGFSRKSTIGAVLAKDVTERLHGATALTALAVQNGINIIRTHDVAATRDAIAMTVAVLDPISPKMPV